MLFGAFELTFDQFLLIKPLLTADENLTTKTADDVIGKK